MSFTATRWVHKQRIASPGAKLLLAVLEDMADDKTFVCFPSVRTLQSKCGLSRRSIFRHLRMLEREGFLRRERRDGPARSNLYHLSVAVLPKKKARSQASEIGPKPAPFNGCADGIGNVAAQALRGCQDGHTESVKNQLTNQSRLESRRPSSERGDISQIANAIRVSLSLSRQCITLSSSKVQRLLDRGATSLDFETFAPIARDATHPGAYLAQCILNKLRYDEEREDEFATDSSGAPLRPWPQGSARAAFLTRWANTLGLAPQRADEQYGPFGARVRAAYEAARKKA